MSALRVGLVGCGRLAQEGYVPALRAATGLRVVAVADPDAGRRARVAALAGGECPVAALPNAAALLAHGVDALVLATPVAAHVADARLAASAGVPVLVEKPPAPDAAGAAELAALRPAPHVGFNRRFDPGVAGLRDATRNITAVRGDLLLHYRRASWRAHTVNDDALLDLGPHLIDLAGWLMRDRPTAVAAHRLAPTAVDVTVTLAHGRARLRGATDRLHDERVRLDDADGRRLAGRRAGGLLGAVRGRLRPRGGEHPLVASLTAQVEAWARALDGVDEPALGTAADGLAVMAVVDAVRRSAARSGATTPVVLPDSSPHL